MWISKMFAIKAPTVQTTGAYQKCMCSLNDVSKDTQVHTQYYL